MYQSLPEKDQDTSSKEKKKDAKDLGREGRLTDAEIDKIQVLAFCTKTFGTLIG